MDTLRNSLQQFLRLFQEMTPSQRGTLIAVPLMVLAGFGLLMYRSGTSSYVPLSWGKSFTPEELMLAEQTLVDAGLTDFRTQGRRVLVPAGQVERYNAALLEGGTLPSNWGAELEKQFEGDGIFSSDRQQQARKDIALAKELRRIIRAVPDIEDANVIWARSQGRERWPYQRQTVTATVNVLPRRNRPLSPQLIHSLRMAVANMVPDLKPEDVAVFDQSTGTSHTADREDDPFGSKLLARIKEFEQLHQQKIYGHLAAYIPDVLVSVNVELDNLKRLTERTQALGSKTVELQLDEAIRNEQFTQQPSRSEPGAVSNRPLELRGTAGTQRSETISATNTSSRSVPQELTISERELTAAMPRAVQVSVSIPRDYYRQVVLQRKGSGPASGAAEVAEEDIQKVKAEVDADVRATVSKLIPSGSPDTAVTVTSHTRIDREPPPADVPLTEMIGDGLSRWGGAVGLVLFAAWALRAVAKSMPKPPPVEAAPLPLSELRLAADDAAEPAGEPSASATEHDRLQSLVRDNPELAAAVIGRWIQTAK